ncbi:MAG TPA: hypothetical protein VLH94_02790 [Spirochaetia bacterium]|nr:hypothetical protein [Spirochaetia bacterium]
MKKKQSYITLSVDEVVKNKYFPYLLVVLLIMGFWFFWTQIRVINIQKKCFAEVFTPTIENAKWSPGKVWTVLYPAYDPAKGARYQYSFWGWGYPETDNETLNYKRCLIWNGIVNPPEMN